MKTFFGILISLIFIPTIVLLIFYFSMTHYIINETYIPQKLSQNDIYDTLSQETLPHFLDNLKNTQAPIDQQQAFDNTILKVKNTLTPNWIENFISKSYKYIVQFIKNKTNPEQMNIDLSAISNILTKEELAYSFISSEELKNQFEELPICSDYQKDYCRPEDLNYEQYQNMLYNTLTESENQLEINFDIPKNINLFDILNSNNYVLDHIKNIYNITQTISKIVIGFLILLILLWIITFSSEPDRFVKYLSYNLLITAIIICIISLFPIFSSNLLKNIIGSSIANTIPTDIIHSIINIIKSLFEKTLAISFFIAIISIILIIIYKKRYLSQFINNIKK